MSRYSAVPNMVKMTKISIRHYVMRRQYVTSIIEWHALQVNEILTFDSKCLILKLHFIHNLSPGLLEQLNGKDIENKHVKSKGFCFQVISLLKQDHFIYRVSEKKLCKAKVSSFNCVREFICEGNIVDTGPRLGS